MQNNIVVHGGSTVRVLTINETRIPRQDMIKDYNNDNPK